MKSVILFVLWGSITISALTCIIILYASTPISVKKESVKGVYTKTSLSEQTNIEPELTPIIPALEVTLISSDARPKIVEDFLETYQCPLEPRGYYAQKYVDIADMYNLDFRLLPAISMQESSCCKIIPEGSNNCWGFGIYADQVVKFDSLELGMESVAKTLSKNYSSKGLFEPDEIMRKYTPQSKGTWAAGVLEFMYRMK